MRFEEAENATEFLRDVLKSDKVKRIHEFAESPDEFNYKFEPTTADLPDAIRWQCPILCAAIFYNAVKCFEFLATRAKLTASDSWQCNAAHIGARTGRFPFLSHPALESVNFLAGDFRDRTPAHYAAQHGHLECVRYLVEEKGSPINAADRFGLTLLHVAFESGQKEVVQFLLGRNAEYKVDALGRTPAGAAVEKGQLEILRECPRELLAAVDGRGRTLLHIAAKKGFVETVDFLKEIDAIDVNALDEAGFSALHYAAEYNHVGTIRALLSIPGANRGLPDARGDLPIHVAAAVGAAEAVVALLSRNPDDNNVKNARGRSPLFVAVANGQPAVVRELIVAGANSNDADQDGVTIGDVLGGSSADDIRALLTGKTLAAPVRSPGGAFYDIQPTAPPTAPAPQGGCSVA
jgi:ankyrin repeat protein